MTIACTGTVMDISEGLVYVQAMCYWVRKKPVFKGLDFVIEDDGSFEIGPGPDPWYELSFVLRPAGVLTNGTPIMQCLFHNPVATPEQIARLEAEDD